MPVITDTKLQKLVKSTFISVNVLALACFLMLPLLTYSLFSMAFFVHEYQDFKPVRLNIPSLGYITCSYERTTVLSLSVS